jgi:hypothetical protein
VIRAAALWVWDVLGRSPLTVRKRAAPAEDPELFSLGSDYADPAMLDGESSLGEVPLVMQAAPRGGMRTERPQSRADARRALSRSARDMR